MEGNDVGGGLGAVLVGLEEDLKGVGDGVYFTLMFLVSDAFKFYYTELFL